MQNWLLPEYIQDVLPDEAWRIEAMRARFLEMMRVQGYQLVAPPMLEYVESLLIDGSADMNLRTFKLVDQLSGRTLALRADITPQVARIDAHLLNRQGVARLCYAGNVLHSQPAGLTRARELLQIGAELYGHGGIESDLEIQRMMLQTLASFGVAEVHLDFGHVGVFRALARRSGMEKALEGQLLQALQHKDVAGLRVLAQSLAPEIRSAMLALPGLYGECSDALARAREVLPAYPEILAAMEALEIACANAQSLATSVGIDLADLRGYHYHSGMVFAAYHPGSHDAIALGGRYDELGKSFGRKREATGFSLDLRQIYGLLPGVSVQPGICAPAQGDADLQTAIADLRERGEVVVVDLLGNPALKTELNCDRELVRRDGRWQVVPLD